MTTATIHHNHATFRVILQATSHPGKGFALPASQENTSRQAAMIRMLSCLMDNEVTFTVIGDVGDNMADALAFHTGSARAGIVEADFILARQGTTDGLLTLIKRGTLEYPDKGATVLYLIDDIVDEGGTTALTGPGINGAVSPLFIGLDAGELACLRKANAEYPLGVDAVFLDKQGRIACIPRSTRIGEN
jgi:alpha-D-ribose 1-methylphosphonate 5-triphosphate synthase subunit PhnH